jgi:hypothetical protein
MPELGGLFIELEFFFVAAMEFSIAERDIYIYLEQEKTSFNALKSIHSQHQNNNQHFLFERFFTQKR